MDEAAHAVTRRGFLVGALGASIVAACGRSVRRPSSVLQLNTANVELSKGDSRLAFALFQGDRPLRYVDGAGGTLRARHAETGRRIDDVPVRSFPIVRGAGGDAAKRATEAPDLIFVAHMPFEDAGFWSIDADLRIGGRRERIRARVGVADESQTIAVGRPAVRTPTPTQADHRGVEPICTREPPCTMHTVSLDEALGDGKPTVATFATPALCTSRMCGPDVDVVENVHLRRASEANFVHIEIYRDTGGGEVAPAVAAWKVDQAGEPWVFLIGREGLVKERLSGPVGEWEVDEGVGRLLRA
jgi:hypothetical protein